MPTGTTGTAATGGTAATAPRRRLLPWEDERFIKRARIMSAPRPGRTREAGDGTDIGLYIRIEWPRDGSIAT